MIPKFLIALLIAFCLCLSACSGNNAGRTDGNIASGENVSISEPTDELPLEEGPTEEELEKLFSDAIYEINELATEDPCDYIRHIFSDIEIDQENCVIVDQIPYARTSLSYNELIEYYSNIFVDELLEWVLSTKFVNVEDMVYCCMVGGQTGGNIQLISISKIEGNTYEAVFQYHYGENETKEESSVFEIKRTDAGYRISSIDYRPVSLE